VTEGHKRDQDALRVERATKQAAEYFERTKRVLERDDLAAKTGEMPEDEPPDEKEMTPHKLAEFEPGPHTMALRRATQPLLELFLGRVVDNFQTYVVSIIREVLLRKPEILSSSSYELDVKSILQHPTIDSLVQELVERKVEGLSYRGFKDLADWCQKQGIPLVVSPRNLDQVIELIATRNTIAHNGGIVDQKYLAIIKGSRFKVGEVRKLSATELFAAISSFNGMVDATDRLAVSAFRLEAVDVKFNDLS